MSTLGAARALPEWAEVVLLGGPDDDVAIRSVQVLPDVRSEVPPGPPRSLVAVLAPPARDDWLLDVLLRRVAADGGAAVLLGGTEPLGRASDQVARRLSLPVLGAPDAGAAAVALRVHLSLPELAAARWVTEVVDVLDRANGVEALVAAASARWRRPVWLLDSAGNVVAGDGVPDLPVEDAHDVSAWLAAPVDVTATWVPREVGTDHPRGAYLVVRRSVHDPMRAVQAGLDVLGAALAGRLAQQRLSAERDARQRTSSMSELLQSGGQLPPGAPRRMLDHGWHLGGHHVGVRVDLPAGLDPVALRDEVVRAFRSCSVEAQVVEHGDGWAVWTTFDEAPTPAHLATHAASVRRVQRLLRSTMPTVMGVGSVRQGAEGLVHTLGEAADAARVAVTRAAGGYLVQVDRLGVSQLLLSWTTSESFGPAASSMLTPLREHPGLLETLAAYLDGESSVAHTAAVLGVHRNTVSARVARAADLLGVDLDDPDERLAVQIACRSVLSQR